MEDTGIIVIARNDYYELEIDLQKNRGYILLSGYWDNAFAVKDFLEDIRTGIQKLTAGFTVLIDMIKYNGTASGLHHLHIEAQQIAVDAGVSRIAELFNRNPVLKTFSESYSRETGAITMTFHDKLHAERWLDLY